MKIGLCHFIAAHLKQKHAEMCAQCVTCVIYKPPLFLGLLRAQQPPLNHVDHLNDMTNITKSVFWIRTASACVPTTWEFGAFFPPGGNAPRRVLTPTVCLIYTQGYSCRLYVGNVYERERQTLTPRRHLAEFPSCPFMSHSAGSALQFQPRTGVPGRSATPELAPLIRASLPIHAWLLEFNSTRK